METATEIVVRGYHVDMYGHVNNARYLEFLEEGRWASFEARIDLARLTALGLGFMVVNINVNYRKAVGPGERLLVSTLLEKVGTRSATLKQEIRLKNSGKLVVDALVTFVIADRSGKLVRIDEDIASELSKLEQPAA
jgi:thioesterase-3